MINSTETGLDLAAIRERDEMIPLPDRTVLLAEVERLRGQMANAFAVQWHHLGNSEYAAGMEEGRRQVLAALAEPVEDTPRRQIQRLVCEVCDWDVRLYEGDTYAALKGWSTYGPGHGWYCPNHTADMAKPVEETDSEPEWKVVHVSNVPLTDLVDEEHLAWVSEAESADGNGHSTTI